MKTLWVNAMPKQNSDRQWHHAGGTYYVDVTDMYVAREAVEEAISLMEEGGLEEALRYLKEARNDLALASGDGNPHAAPFLFSPSTWPSRSPA